MRWFFGIVVAGVFTTGVRAGEAEELLAQAIKAMAGTPEKLNALKHYTSKAAGTMFGEKASREIRMSWPGTFRMDTEFKVGKDEMKVRVLLHEGRGWMQVLGRPQAELTRTEVAELNNDVVYALWLANLFPLREKGVVLKTAPEIGLPAGAAAGMKVSIEGRPDVLMYFDKKTRLPVKIALPGKEQGVKILREIDFGKHREVDGIKLPFEETESHSGQKAVTWNISEIKLPEQLDEGVLKP